MERKMSENLRNIDFAKKDTKDHLISQNAVLDFLHQSLIVEMSIGNTERAEAILSTIAKIKELPPVEVQEAKAGYWIVAKSEQFLPTNRFVCSECHGLVQVSTYRYKCLYKYCPTCGAKMEDVTDEAPR